MNNILIQVYENIKSQKLGVADKDLKRPWGGFFVINTLDIQKFLNIYFNELKDGDIKPLYKLSPKILVIFPKKRLSWSYHNRRKEIWKVFSGSIKVIKSHDDIEREKITLNEGEVIRLNKGERHRIIGTNNYAVIAEIWVHTDKNNPSNEDDIIRVQDDFNR